MSADGRYVAFSSSATNLAAGDTSGTVNVYRYDRATGATVRVSVAIGGGPASGPSGNPEISDDGNLVAFQSAAFDLVANDANGAVDVFVRDMAAGTTERISVGLAGGDGDLASTLPALSGDGRYVAFSSLATSLVVGDNNNVSDVFLRDRVAGTTARVSVSSTNGQADQASFGASVSGDGRFVSFLSTATTLVSGAPRLAALYVRDTQAQTTTRTQTTTATVESAGLSSDGRYAAGFIFLTGVFVRDRFAAVTVMPGTSGWVLPAISSNGRYVVALDGIGGVVVTPNPL